MGIEDREPLDEKAKGMRDLLSSFYSPDLSSAMPPSNASFSRFATLDTINTTSFEADHYMNLLVQKSNLEELLKKHVEMASEIKNLDTDLQTLVYENYNKFISATDAIKREENPRLISGKLTASEIFVDSQDHLDSWFQTLQENMDMTAIKIQGLGGTCLSQRQM